MKSSFKRGFTLIELLVVIAIIGLLASIVLVAVGNARQKGANAAVSSNLANIRTIAEVYAQENNPYSYWGLCTSTTNKSAQNAIKAAKDAAGITGVATANNSGAGSAGTATCNVSATAWVVQSPLNNPTSDSWCVDSAGFSGTTTPAAAITSATDYTCN